MRDKTTVQLRIWFDTSLTNSNTHNSTQYLQEDQLCRLVENSIWQSCQTISVKISAHGSRPKAFIILGKAEFRLEILTLTIIAACAGHSGLSLRQLCLCSV